VRCLLTRLKEVGDQAVVHGLRGRPSNRRLSEKTREKAVRVDRYVENRGVEESAREGRSRFR
jgi:hypothetical protein